MKEYWIDTPRGRLFAGHWGHDLADERAPIVLLHDSLGCVALWRDFPARLSQATGRAVVAYDRLGFGRSAPYPGVQPESFIIDEPHGAFAALREALGLERFVLLGHSVGGCMAVTTAGQHSEGCEALITVAAQAFTEARTLAGIRAAERGFADPDQMARLARHHGDKAEWVLRAWVDNWHSETFQAWRLDDALAEVRCPTLALHGELDEFGSTAQPRRIAALTAGPAEVQILADCGHVPHRESRDEVIESIAAFLARCQAQPLTGAAPTADPA